MKVQIGSVFLFFLRTSLVEQLHKRGERVREREKESVCVCVCLAYSLRLYGLEPAMLHFPWNFPGSNTGAGCHFLLQGIFLVQGSNLCFLCFLHWQLYNYITWETLYKKRIRCPKLIKGFPAGTSGKEPACQYRRHKRLGFNPWVRQIPWRRKW